MLRNFWGKLTGTGATARKHEEEMEDMSEDERNFAGESMEDIAADNMASDRYGAWGSKSMLGENDPPPFS